MTNNSYTNKCQLVTAFGSPVVTCTSSCHTVSPKDQTLLRHLGRYSPYNHPMYFSPPPGLFPAASLGSVRKVLGHRTLVLTLTPHQSLPHPLQPQDASASLKQEVVFHLLIIYFPGVLFSSHPTICTPLLTTQGSSFSTLPLYSFLDERQTPFVGRHAHFESLGKRPPSPGPGLVGWLK